VPIAYALVRPVSVRSDGGWRRPLPPPCARDCFAHGPPADSIPHRDESVQVIGSLIHQFRLESGTHGIRIGVPGALCLRSTDPDSPPCRWPP
jgi:hypothetical protein